MAEVQFTAGAVFDIASRGEVRAEMDGGMDRLYSRLTGDKRCLYKTIPGSWFLPAGTYSNGVAGVIDFGSPSFSKLWLIQSCVWIAETSTGALSLATVAPVSLFIGVPPQQLTVSTVSDKPALSNIAAPLLNSVSAGGATPYTFDAPLAVLPNETPYLYWYIPTSVTPAADVTYHGVLRVAEYDNASGMAGSI